MTDCGNFDAAAKRAAMHSPFIVRYTRALTDTDTHTPTSRDRGSETTHDVEPSGVPRDSVIAAPGIPNGRASRVEKLVPGPFSADDGLVDTVSSWWTPSPWRGQRRGGFKRRPRPGTI